MIKIQQILVTLKTFLRQLKILRKKLYTKEDTSKTTTSELLSKICMRKKISKQHLTFVRLTELEIKTFVFLCRCY